MKQEDLLLKIALLKEAKKILGPEAEIDPKDPRITIPESDEIEGESEDLEDISDDDEIDLINDDDI